MIKGKELKRLHIRRNDDGSISADYDGKEIPGIVAASVQMTLEGAVATIAFPIGEVDVDSEISRVFGAVEVPAGLAGIPDDELQEV